MHRGVPDPQAEPFFWSALGCGETRWAVHETPSKRPPRSRARAYGARMFRVRRSVLGLATLLCRSPCHYRSLFVLLGQVMSYGAAHFDKVTLLTTTQHSTPTNRRKPSAAEKGGSVACSDLGNPTRTHAEEGRAERNGQAERSGEGRVRGSPPTTTQHSTPTRR